MQIPPGIEAEITEEIMREWSAANPKADTRTYNATYSKTLEIVRAKLEDDKVRTARVTPLRFGANEAGVIVRAPSLLEKLAFRP